MWAWACNPCREPQGTQKLAHPKTLALNPMLSPSRMRGGQLHPPGAILTTPIILSQGGLPGRAGLLRPAIKQNRTQNAPMLSRRSGQNRKNQGKRESSGIQSTPGRPKPRKLDCSSHFFVALRSPHIVRACTEYRLSGINRGIKWSQACLDAASEYQSISAHAFPKRAWT